MKTKNFALGLVLTFACTSLFAATNTETNFANTPVTDSIPTDSIPTTDTLHKTDTTTLKNNTTSINFNSAVKTNSANDLLKNQTVFAIVPEGNK